MRITTLNQLKEYTTYTYYKLNKPEYTKKKKVYICQPINYIDEGCTHMDIWSGYIFYKTNAVSRNVEVIMVFYQIKNQMKHIII